MISTGTSRGYVRPSGTGIDIQLDMYEVLLMVNSKYDRLRDMTVIEQIQDDGVDMFQAIYQDCPVDTGYLRSTGRYRRTMRGFEITWGDDIAYYWRYVEWGTSKMKGRFFITRNYYQYRQQIWDNFRKTMRGR